MEKYNDMKEFMELNKKVINNNPIIKSFLDNKDNYILVKKAVSNLTNKNMNRVDLAFKKHYEQVKIISYISKLIHFFSIDFDKKSWNINNTYLLTLDKPLSDQETKTGSTVKDFLTSNDNLSFNAIYGSSLKEQIENEKLKIALDKLTPNQLQILELIYLKDLHINEIASKLDTSPQNVTNQHRKSIIKLYHELN